MKKGLIISAIVVVVIAIVLVIVFSSTGPKGNMAELSYVDIEASVVSLGEDPTDNFEVVGVVTNVPNDFAVLKIDKIVKTGGDSNYDWSSENIVEGQEVSIIFEYTVRPAKIITKVGETTTDGNTVSHRIVPTEVTKEEDMFVITINGNTESELNLPGLNAGDRISARILQPSPLYSASIKEYEII